MSAHKTYTRFDIARRIEHLLLILSFGTLAITGLAQKFPLNSFAQWVVALYGGIESIRVIHRIAATLMMLETIYHIVYLFYLMYVRRVGWSMLPEVKDATDALQMFLYNLGIRKQAPRMKRYNFTEKAEYWAMIWGTAVMGITGFMLWNPIATAKILPGVFIPAAKAIHGYEAILAALAIIVWHFYNVHLRGLNLSMINGKLKHHEMEEEHALELEEMESGEQQPPLAPEVKKKRMKVFVPVSAVFVALSLVGVVAFVTVEDSAIETIPPLTEKQEIFLPQTPTPAPTPLPTLTPAPVAEGQSEVVSALTWDGQIAQLFKDRCAACHGAAGGYSVDSYEDAMAGGNQGVAILPGDAASSPLVVLQESQHPVTFSAEELALVKNWINAGAPDK